MQTGERPFKQRTVLALQTPSLTDSSGADINSDAFKQIVLIAVYLVRLLFSHSLANAFFSE